jgi:hypothetical protein
MSQGIALRSALLFLVLASWVGCSSAPESARDAGPPRVHRSRDGRLQYITPAGWFDATADAQAAGRAVWIIRNDYGGTLTIDEVKLDEAARRSSGAGGLEPIARLLMTLPSGERPVRAIRDPETVEQNGRVYCAYEVEVYETRDLLRVVLFRAGERVYASTLVVPAAVRDRGYGQLLEAQSSFLGSVSWASL